MVDLSITLPAGIKTGGVFALAAASRPLPTGFSLSPNGMLSMSNPATGVTDGVIFSYTEPAA